MASKIEFETHNLINKQRRQKGLPPVRWSPKMYSLAKEHSKKMAKAGRLFHSGRFALYGGEVACGGKGYHSPRSFVESWLKSPRHRGWLLDRRVRVAAVGVSSSGKGTFAAWSFSE